MAEELHARFKKIVDASGQECHFTIGNHDRYYFSDGEDDKTGYKTFEKHLGASYTSFDRQGVHFITLNSLNPDPDGRYSIGAEQAEWLKADLEATGKATPSSSRCMSRCFPSTTRSWTALSRMRT